MSNNIRYSFSIRDLENFSGIKAHTIRIWEKRYDVLEPSRTGGNQRTYGLSDLQKLLSIKLLYDKGHRISKIADYSLHEINGLVTEIISASDAAHEVIDVFKVAMLDFDQALFEKTYQKLIANLSFRRVYCDVFIPLLEQIGYLWSVDSITPAHEHFISNLIQRKILSNIEIHHTRKEYHSDDVFVLFLPHGEIHELGLLYFHYELTIKGYKSIYLGQSIPLENLNDLQVIYPQLTFVSYSTVQPDELSSQDYLNRIGNDLLNRSSDRFWLLGKRIAAQDQLVVPPRLTVFKNLEDAVMSISE